MGRVRTKWPEHIRGDVLFVWRQELNLSRRAAAQLLGLVDKTLEYHEYTTAQREEAKKRTAQWQKDHPEKRSEYNDRYYEKKGTAVCARYRAKHKEKLRARRKKWAEANPEKQREAKRRWKIANRDRGAAHARARRTRKAGANGTCSVEQAAARIAFYGGVCAYCRRAPHEHLDHVIPLSRGGTNWPANLRPSCQKCNTSKNDKLLSEWSSR